MSNVLNFKNGRRTKLLAMVGAALMAGAPVATAFAQAQDAPPPPPSMSDRGPGADGQRGDGPRWGKHHGKRDGWHRGHGGHGKMARQHRRMMREMFSPAKLAGALAAMETGIGITPEQMGVWRTFTGALVTFVETSKGPRWGGRDRGPDQAMANPSDDEDETTATAPDDDSAEAAAPDDTDDATSDEPGDTSDTADAGDQTATLPALRFLDRMADRAIERADAAQKLKSAIADLQSALTPEQVQAARGLMRSMMRDARQEFRAERQMRRGHHGGPRGMHERGPGRHHGHRWDDRQERGDRGGPQGPKGPQQDDGPQRT